MSQEMKVGELAARTGLSVRTLHHYDDIGLLTPTRRTASGHRLYGRAEIERLQQIASLKHLGLSLDRIAECLARPDHTLEHALDRHLERLDEEIVRRKTLRSLVVRLRDRLRAAEEVSVEDVTRTIEVTMNVEKHYTPDQLKQLEQRRNEVGEERIAEVQREWQALFTAYERAMNEGLDPASEEVKALARKSAELIGEFTGGDTGIERSLGNMYREEGPENVLSAHGMQMAPGLWEYMGAARAALDSSTE